MISASDQAATPAVVRPLLTTDLDQVVAIEARIQPRPWTRAVFAAELAQPDTRCYLAAVPRGSEGGGGRVRGFGGIMVATDEAHVTTLGVDPDAQRRKVGSRLLLALLRAAVTRGAMAATLEVRHGNAGAIRLYQRFGFAPVGLRPGYYNDTHEDAMIMWAHDVQGAAFAARLDALSAELGDAG